MKLLLLLLVLAGCTSAPHIPTHVREQFDRQGTCLLKLTDTIIALVPCPHE